MEVDVARILDVSLSVAVAVVAIIQMSRAHAECRQGQALLAERLMTLLEKLSEQLVD